MRYLSGVLQETTSFVISEQMKKLLTLTCLLILSSCAKEIPSEQLVKRQGVFYEINTTTPFTGNTVGYHKNGQLKSRTNFKDGKLDGLWEEYYENGQLQIDVCYKHGKRDGRHGRGVPEVRQARLQPVGDPRHGLVSGLDGKERRAGGDDGALGQRADDDGHHGLERAVRDRRRRPRRPDPRRGPRTGRTRRP